MKSKMSQRLTAGQMLHRSCSAGGWDSKGPRIGKTGPGRLQRLQSWRACTAEPRIPSASILLCSSSRNPACITLHMIDLCTTLQREPSSAASSPQVPSAYTNESNIPILTCTLCTIMQFYFRRAAMRSGWRHVGRHDLWALCIPGVDLASWVRSCGSFHKAAEEGPDSGHSQLESQRDKDLPLSLHHLLLGVSVLCDEAELLHLYARMYCIHPVGDNAQAARNDNSTCSISGTTIFDKHQSGVTVMHLAERCLVRLPGELSHSRFRDKIHHMALHKC